MPPPLSKADPLQQVLAQVNQESRNEDLTGLTEGDVRKLTMNLWAWASSVAPGMQDARVLIAPEGESAPLQRSVLEAVGPDMPFLVDSLLGECASAGHEVKALFHPIVNMEDGRGRAQDTGFNPRSGQRLRADEGAHGGRNQGHLASQESRRRRQT